MIEPGVYKHYKGGLYTVLMTGWESTNDRHRDEVVIYVSHTTGAVNVRDLDEFDSGVEVNGHWIRRFEYLHPQPSPTHGTRGVPCPHRPKSKPYVLS